VKGVNSVSKLLKHLTLFGKTADKAADLREQISEVESNPNTGSLHESIWDVISNEIQKSEYSQRDVSEILHGKRYTFSRTRIRPQRIREIANVIESDRLREIGNQDIVWEKVRSVKHVGSKKVYDMTVPGPENWVSNGIVSHNSGNIEQDTDCAIFIYRPEEYGITRDDQGNSLEGVAKLIVGKHRAGPTGVANVHFSEKYATFEPLSYM
jgi:replicative DNA helicase